MKRKLMIIVPMVLILFLCSCMKTSNDNQVDNNQVLYDYKDNEFKRLVIDNFIYDTNLKVLGRYVDGYMESDNIISIIENGTYIKGQLNLKGIYYPPC